MAQSAAVLVDEVIPQAPVRQWVLSFPIGLRILFAARPALLTPVLRLIHRVIAGFLLKRVFAPDIEHCPQCGGDMKIIAAIEEPEVVARILSHLGLSARAPPRAPARRLDLFEAA